MVPVVLKEVMMSRAGFVVLLAHEDSGRILPIHVGTAEAQAILFAQRGIKIPRPLTHDLMRNLLRALGTELVKVTVRDFRDTTFYATLTLDAHGRQLDVDARPSDSIALALRSGAPIFVAPAVMDEAGLSAAELEGTAMARKKESAHNVDPLTALREALDRAVGEERYEDAAQLRDEIAKRMESQ